MKHKLLLALTTLGLVGSVNAATVSTFGSGLSATDWNNIGLDFETFTPAASTFNRGMTQARGEFVQSFTVGSSLKIDSIYTVVRGGTENTDFQIRIFELPDVGTNTPGNVLLNLATNTASFRTGAANINNNLIEIDLIGIEEVTLAANTAYGIGFQATTATTPFELRFSGSSEYAGGQSFGDGVGATNDLMLGFTAVVPEASSLALLGVSGGLMLLRRRRS